jgi:AraC-like DNA-binding protein
VKKHDHPIAPHLAVKNISVAPGREWLPRLAGWTMIQVRAGAGYWVHPRLNQELQAGAVLLFAESAAGSVRASQLGEISLDYFRVEPARLIGLITLGERRALESAANDAKSSLRVFPPDHALSVKLKKLCAETTGDDALSRLGWLRLFVEAFGNELTAKSPEAAPQDARLRLRQFLGQTPAFELLDLSLPDLARIAGCTPRHLSRIFHEVVGMSFREEQAAVRLARALELLSSTDSKVVDIALDSGYSSLSLFNVMFKRRYGVSPGKWRQQKLQQTEKLTFSQTRRKSLRVLAT